MGVIYSHNPIVSALRDFQMTANVNTDPLLRTLTLKGITFRNRIMSTAHACGLEDADGMPGETYQRYHQEKARGGLALTMFGGSAYIQPDSTWASGQLNLSTDKVIPHLQQFSERVHGEGAAIMMQISHLGRRGETNSQNWLPTVAPSRVREAGHRSFPKAMDRHDIDRIVAAFAASAARCEKGGLDGLETMTAGHLIGQFFSPITNLRTDEFGGSLENRCRFAVMVHEAIRETVGSDFIIGMRMTIDEAMQGGLTFEDCVAIAQHMQSKGLVDFFNVNYGRIDTEHALIKDCMPGMASPIAPWMERAGAFKRAVSLPVFHAARITDLASARYAISEGLLDMVAMTRAHIADPHIVNKIRSGNEERIRPCVGATHCMGTSRPTCLHNAATGRERFWTHSHQPAKGMSKRVVVIGGGPAGLEAARVCASRGHHVSLFEAASELGGQVRLAAQASWRGDLIGLVDWRISELEALGVEVHLNRYVELDDVDRLDADVVIIATGGVPDLEWLDGAEHCTSVWDVVSGTEPYADDVVIYDGTGRHPALTAADRFPGQPDAIQLVLRDDRPGTELDYGERMVWKRTLAERHIVPQTEWRLVRVTPVDNQLDAHFVHELTDESRSIRTAQVIVEHGTTPADELFHQMRGQSVNDGAVDFDALLSGNPQPMADVTGMKLYRIGDAVSSRNIAAAVFDALRLASHI